jgi:hypothetical protein
VATDGSHDGGVEATQPSAFGRHIGRAQPQLTGAGGVLFGHRGGQLAAGQLGGDLERDQRIGEHPRPRLNVKIGLGQPVHESILRCCAPRWIVVVVATTTKDCRGCGNHDKRRGA